MADSEDAILLQRRARRRLVGAIALVVFTVIVLPIVFDKEPRPPQDPIVIQIPDQDTRRFKSPVVQPAPGPVEPAQTGAQSAAAGPALAAEPEKSPAATGARPPASETPRVVPEGERFVIVLGAYANRDNVKQLQARLAAAGYRSLTEKMDAPKGEQMRLSAGPFPTRNAAEKARVRLKAQGLLPRDAVVRQEP